MIQFTLFNFLLSPHPSARRQGRRAAMRGAAVAAAVLALPAVGAGARRAGLREATFYEPEAGAVAPLLEPCRSTARGYLEGIRNMVVAAVRRGQPVTKVRPSEAGPIG